MVILNQKLILRYQYQNLQQFQNHTYLNGFHKLLEIGGILYTDDLSSLKTNLNLSRFDDFEQNFNIRKPGISLEIV